MLSKIVVMVVERNKEDLITICNIFRSAGVNKLICLDSREEALDYLKTDSEVDIMIVDESLGGSDLISEVKDDYKHIQSILCEDTTDVVGGLRARSRGACEFIRKDRFRRNLSSIVPLVVQRVSTYQKVMYGGYMEC